MKNFKKPFSSFLGEKSTEKFLIDTDELFEKHALSDGGKMNLV